MDDPSSAPADHPPRPTLGPDDSRILGVLVEKAQTVPGQYPITLNGLISGANQRSNRDPVLSLDEDDVLAALDRLRAMGLVREVMLSGSRVAKFKHDARAVLGVGTPELVVLAELMLRGPQTPAELRSRASRMHALESTDVVDAVLEAMAARPEPLVRRAGRTPGGRAERWAQLLCPDLHPIDASATAASAPPAPIAAPASAPASQPAAPTELASLERRVAELESRLASFESRLSAVEGPSNP